MLEMADHLHLRIGDKVLQEQGEGLEERKELQRVSHVEAGVAESDPGRDHRPEFQGVG